MADIADTADPMSLLPEETAASLRRLELAVARRKDGTVNGRHRGTHKGSSVEFAEHREYAPGDDLRDLDWRVYAKRDRPYVRQYVEETNLRCTLAVDVSGSMGYTGRAAAPLGGRPLSKLCYARYFAAALAHLLVGQRDATGLVTFDTEVRAHVPPATKPGQVREVLGALAAAQAGGETGAGAALDEVASRIPPRGLVVLISDLFDEPEETAAALHHFGQRGHELAVVHVMADEELTFPFDRYSEFEDLEGGGMLGVDAEAVRADYLARVRGFVDQVGATCGGLGARYLPANTKTPYTEVLGEYLGGG